MFEFWQGKRVLITGHTGFKGSWLAFWLKMLGAEVSGYALAPETEPNLFDNLKLENQINSMIGDIRDLEKFAAALDEFQPEIVFHLAAQSLVRKSYKQPVETYQTNVIGTVNVLEAIRRAASVKAAVIITTDKVYENNEWHWAYRENERLGGFDPYSNSKACAELAVSAYRNSFFAENECLIATARAGNVIGGGDWSEDRLLPDVFRFLIFDKPLVIRYPNAVRPWQHVLEPLAGYMKLAEKLYAGEKSFGDAWNFGSSEADAKSVGWILEKIKNIWNAPVHWQIEQTKQPHEAGLLKLDSTKAKTTLGWQPVLNITQAIDLTAEWFKNFKDGANPADTTRRQIDFYTDLLEKRREES